MEDAHYTSIKGVYTIRECSLEDITEDLQAVESELSNLEETISDRTGYIHNMFSSVVTGYARCVELDGIKIGFLYILDNGDGTASACSITMTERDMVGLTLLMLKSRLGKFKELRVVPHGSNFKLFRSMINKRSIYYYHRKRFPYVVIRYGKHSMRLYVKLLRRYSVKRLKENV